MKPEITTRFYTFLKHPRSNILNPHGSDETENTPNICVYARTILNPHGSDET